MIYLNLAFDHELSLGGVTSSYDKNLLTPTRQILSLAEELSVPVTFFTDVLCGIRFREWDADGFSQSYESQLREIANRGQDIQLHLHPHWVDSTFAGGRFIPASRYSLHDFRTESPPNDIAGIVSRGVEFLYDVIGPVDPAYQCEAFRAGGLVIDPSQDEVVTALRQNGIRFDSSVAPGYRFSSSVSGVDFSSVPNSGNWVLGEHGLFEVPIATAPRNAFNNLPALARRVVRRSMAPDTGGYPLYDVNSGALDRLYRLFPRSAWFLSFDLYWASGAYLLSILNSFLSSREIGDGDCVYISTLSHPKSMGPGGLKVMADFVRLAREQFGSELEFVSFPDIASSTGFQPGSNALA